ncbi:Fic family protein [Sulfurimonas indica]|uniref:Fic family protein n=1 Tax=Sulfurimonas indica TaxID=2508707 RepID=UPI001264CF60|nr:Fic family protein [Sulfurimonas indica]
MNIYTPPYTITSKMLTLTNDISEMIATISTIKKERNTPILRKKNRVRSITGSLQIEGNTLSQEEITAIIDGKRVLGSVKEIEEVKGAIESYEHIHEYDPKKLEDLLLAHKLMMGNILNNAGEFRASNVGIYGKDGVSHVAPPPYKVHDLMRDLFDWLAITKEHPLIVSSVFHYEFEFIHPFSDGNGRIGRLWQSVILGSFREIFYFIPIESVVKEYQSEYYKALEEAGSCGESTPFVEFMLESIQKAVSDFIKEYQKSDPKSSLKSDQKIFTLMLQDSKITIKELSLRLAMSESGIKKAINKLKQEGKIKRVGSAKGGYWEVYDE